MARAANLSGAALAIAQRGALVGSWTYGVASQQFATPVQQDTLFSAASVAKHVTALAVLQLRDQGAVKLEESVRTYLPVLPAKWTNRTLRSLLTHTSGLPDITLGPRRIPDRDDPTREQLVERMQFREALFEPGEGWSYCNSNYLILGWLVEDLTRLSLSKSLTERVLRRGGATRAQADGPGVATRRLAEPYVYDDGRYWRTPFLQTEKADGAGTLQWSIEDIAPWGDALARRKVASARSMNELFSWTPLKSGVQTPYGFGFFLDRVGGAPVHWHTGGTPGAVAIILQLPQHGLTVAFMTNTDPPGRFARKVAWKAAASVVPQATYLYNAPVAPDAVDRRVAALGQAPGPLKPDRDLMAEDFLRVLADPTEQRRFATGFTPDTRLERVEAYATPSGHMRRYRVTDAAGGVDYKLAGFDHADRLYWLWAC